MSTIVRMWNNKTVIALCCICGRARDDFSEGDSWVSLKDHLSIYGLQVENLVFSHTFCPVCSVQYQHLFDQRKARMARV